MKQRRRYPAALMGVAVVLLAAAVLIQPAPGEAQSAPATAAAYEDGTVLVGFRAGVSRAEVAAIAQQQGLALAEVVGAGTHVFHVGPGNVPARIAALQRHPAVRYAEPNYIVSATTSPASNVAATAATAAAPNDPSYGQLWGLKNTGQSVNGTSGTAGADVKAEPAWAVTTGSAGIVVGVVDTGIDYTHPDLQANVWSATAPISFTVSDGATTSAVTCAAGTHGFNAITGACDPMDDNNHGSHVSGTIGAAGTNALGVVGVNEVTSLMGLKFLDASGNGTNANAIKAIDFAVRAKISGAANVRVLNNSWGNGPFSQAVLDEIVLAGDHDVLFVAAAANAQLFLGTDNDSMPNYPCNYEATNLICTAATDQKDGLATFSNYGPKSVHLGAPGRNILSTIIGGQYAYKDGTSMAAPHVSGAAALILATQPGLTTLDVRAAILNNVDPLPSLAGKTVTGGRLNVCKAIPACAGTAGASPTPTPTALPSATATSTSTSAATSTSTKVPAATATSSATATSTVGSASSPTATTPPATATTTATRTPKPTATPRPKRK
jgi:serine protease